MEAQDIQFSAEMSVSRRGSLDCSEIARTLALSGVCAKVSANISSVPRGRDAWPRIEHGCTVTVPCTGKNDIGKAWEVTRARFPDLKCAHLAVPGVFRGCIHDFLGPSLCPGKSI